MFDAYTLTGTRDVRFDTYTMGTQQDARGSFLADGRLFVTFEDSSGATGDTDRLAVVRNILAADTFAPGAVARVSTPTTGQQQVADTLTLSNGNVLVTYQDQADGVLAKIFTAAGEQVGNEIIVFESDTQSIIGGAATINADGQFTVVYRVRTGTNATEIFARTYGDDGVPAGGPVSIGSLANGTVQELQIVTLENGNMVVTYDTLIGDRQPDSNGVELIILSPSLTVLKGSFSASTETAGKSGRTVMSPHWRAVISP